MEPFKNQFSAENAARIAAAVRSAHPAFPTTKFRRGLEAALDPLELKPRMHLIADRLEAGLPDDPRETFPILVRALDAGDLRGFLVWPLTEIVARRGAGHFAASMAALHEMTKRFTAEWAVRPFLRDDPARTLARLAEWCADPDEHVRRLVSEGSRPLLPWGMRLPRMLEAPFPTLGLLETLHRDPSDYVRLSVSNHLNDLSKHQPDLVVRTLRDWNQRAPGDPRLAKLTRHACRTMLKAGHPGALALLGYGPAGTLELSEFSLDAGSVRLGGSIGYRLAVRNPSRTPRSVMFDYAVHHRKANGSLSPKVFKGRVRTLAGGETWEITGRHSFRIVTTRVYHPGGHAIAPILNGRAFEPLPFELET